jgi:hypothetical protein
VPMTMRAWPSTGRRRRCSPDRFDGDQSVAGFVRGASAQGPWNIGLDGPCRAMTAGRA